MDSTATPPSGVTQTAPAPPPPPEKVTPEPTPQGATGPTSAQPEVTAFDIAVRAPQPSRNCSKNTWSCSATAP
jgi:translocation and assembly module TamA